MAKYPVYLRIAKGKKGKYKVWAGTKPTDDIIKDASGRAMPTIHFGVEFDIPDICFNKARIFVAAVDVNEKQAKVSTSIISP